MLIAALVLYAAIPKFADIEKYSVFILYSYQISWLMPNMAHTRILGYLAPYMETLFGFGLIMGVFTRLSAVGWGLVSLVYIVVKAQVIFMQWEDNNLWLFPQSTF